MLSSGKEKKWGSSSLAFIFLLLASSLAIFAQSPSAPASAQNSDDIVTCYVTMISVEAQVFDGSGKEILSLTKGDFTIYDDGVRQKIDKIELLRDEEAVKRKSRYVLNYFPLNDVREGKTHSVRVALKPLLRHHLKLKYTPNNYTAPKEKTDGK